MNETQGGDRAKGELYPEADEPEVWKEEKEQEVDLGHHM